MKKEENQFSLSVIMESISYFISGWFVIYYISPHLCLSEDINLFTLIWNWITFVISWILIGIGIIRILVALPAEKKYREYFDEKKEILAIVLFAIAIARLSPLILNFENVAISILAIILFSLITIYIIISLIWVSFAIVIATIFNLLREENFNTSIIPLIITGILLLWSIRKYTMQEKKLKYNLIETIHEHLSNHLKKEKMKIGIYRSTILKK